MKMKRADGFYLVTVNGLMMWFETYKAIFDKFEDLIFVTTTPTASYWRKKSDPEFRVVIVF